MLKKYKSFIVFIVFALAAAAWAILLNPGDELFYMIFAQYLVLPFTAFICSILCVKRGKALGWLAPLIFAAIIICLPFIVFGATNISFAVFALIPAVLGYIIGGICYSVKNY
ncbi:MAG: hypothetical protein IIX36_04230 [Clostridia bacterium]|nr:hypothetical protein [Clostridia bacterium]